MVRLAATIALQTKMRLTMPSGPPLKTMRRIELITSGLQEALCASEAFAGARRGARCLYGRIEAPRSPSWGQAGPTPQIVTLLP